MSVLEQFNIKNRSAIVTGAASGIGLAYAETLAEAGAQVTLSDVNGDKVQRQTDRLKSEGYDVRAAVLDISNRAQATEVFDGHMKAYGGLDIAFANAGIDAGEGFWNPEGHRNPNGQIDTLDPERGWDRVINVNLTGTFNTMREAVRCMKATGRGGSIVATSSNAAVICEPVVGLGYMPAKAGVSHMVKHLALELASFRIRVNAVLPGPFVTNIGGGWLNDPVVRKTWDDLVPLGHIADTSEIKGLALYLASDASSYVTGSQIMIDGGMSLGKAH